MLLELPPLGSLKEKRRILKSLLTKLRQDFNVSIAEVGHNDQPRRALIGGAVVSNSSSFGHQVMSKVVSRVENDPQIILSDYRMETY
jgi:uncharacterized protein YlxP (DUF503 family)